MIAVARGYNSSGQLGNGSTADCVVPTKLDMPAAVSDVTCGGNHTLVQLQGHSHLQSRSQ